MTDKADSAKLVSELRVLSLDLTQTMNLLEGVLVSKAADWIEQHAPSGANKEFTHRCTQWIDTACALLKSIGTFEDVSNESREAITSLLGDAEELSQALDAQTPQQVSMIGITTEMVEVCRKSFDAYISGPGYVACRLAEDWLKRAQPVDAQGEGDKS